MALNLKYSVAIKNAQLNVFDGEIGSSGFLRIYSGTQPTNPDTALSSNVLLAELPLSTTAFAAASSGTIAAAAITDEASAPATGTAAWFSLVQSDGTREIDGSAGTSSSDLIMDSVSITAGQVVAASSLVFTAGN